MTWLSFVILAFAVIAIIAVIVADLLRYRIARTKMRRRGAARLDGNPPERG